MARIFTFDKTIIYIHEPNFYAHEKKNKTKKKRKNVTRKEKKFSVFMTLINVGRMKTECRNEYQKRGWELKCQIASFCVMQRNYNRLLQHAADDV